MTQLFEKYRLIYELTVLTPEGEPQQIDTTDDHPFFVEDKGWVDTIDLVAGDLIVTKEEGWVKVHSVVNSQRYEKTYNLEVADFHTYYATELGLLVHNCDVTKNGLPGVKKVVNSNLPHARDRAVERGVFADAKPASEGLKDLSSKIKKEGFPEGTLRDTANADRMLVPVGNNGLAVYQVGKNGTAKLKTTLIAN